MKRLAIGLAIGALALVGCGNDSSSNGYPQAAVDAFMKSCTAAPNASEDQCRCAITKIQDTVSYADFKQYGRDILTGDSSSPPQGVVDAVNECR
jgi:hypothetical protein